MQKACTPVAGYGGSLEKLGGGEHSQNSQLHAFKHRVACYLYICLAVLFAVSTCVSLCFALKNLLRTGKADWEVFHVECQESKQEIRPLRSALHTADENQ